MFEFISVVVPLSPLLAVSCRLLLSIVAHISARYHRLSGSCARVYIYLYIYMYISMNLYIYRHISIYIYIDICLYIYRFIDIYIYMYRYIYTLAQLPDSRWYLAEM